MPRNIFPKPRSDESIANLHYRKNRITFVPELVIKGGKRLDFGIFLNGLPIMTLELKHEKNQTVHDFDNFTHLQGVVGYAKKSRHLKEFLKTGRSIGVSTQLIPIPKLKQ